ncbi:MAG TPA: ATP-binding protein, partial [Solirubrobacterales bacterium]|nr:ATP-binding protein [Solirubrobacterales bacterium]
FTLVMVVVLGATGVFVYLRFGAELDSTINAGLRSRASDVAALVKEVDSGLRERRRGGLVGRSESFAEVLDPSGKVLDSTLSVGRHVLLSPAELRRAELGPFFLNRGPLPGLRDESRLLAVPVRARDQRLVVVVGTSTEARSESQADLLQLLLVGGPVALLLASLAAYGVATAALRPVEAMRARAAQVSTAEPDQRLPVPPTNDEIARLGVTLNAMLGRLGEALARERRFVGDASHELRTPLAILKAELDLALSQGRSPAELRTALASAAEETDRLIQLAEDLLTIAQTDQGELPVRLAPTDIGEVLNGVTRRFSRRAEDGGRALEVSVEPGLEAAADRLRLDQALGNLLDNALRYGSGPVGLTAVGRDGSVELHVLDRGPGFAEDFLGRAFERFSRADASQRDGGSGLGLSIVDSIARAHRGEAHVANREGGGADVWLTLPSTTLT